METRTVKLGDLSSDLKGQYGINASAVPLRTTLPTYLRITDIDDFGRIKHDGLCSVETDELNKYSLREGDLVFARTGNSTGRNYWYDSHDGSFVFAGFLIRFHFEETEELVPRFLKYYVQSTEYYDWIEGFSTGSTRKNLNARDYGNLPVVLPPKSYQQKVVAILDMIENKILLNQQINKNLLRLAKQQFNLTFPNVHEGNSRLSNVMENFDRKRIPLARREREKRQGVYRYVGATSVLDYVDDYLFDGTYLLMGEDGTVQDEKGFPILQYIWGKFWPNNHTHVLSGTFVSTEWLYLFLMNTNVRSRITGAVQQKISQANMNSIPLTIPSKDELFRFQKQIEPVFSQIQLLDEQNLKLTAIHKLLLPKLLAGQIDLSNLEGAIQNA